MVALSIFWPYIQENKLKESNKLSKQLKKWPFTLIQDYPGRSEVRQYLDKNEASYSRKDGFLRVNKMKLFYGAEYCLISKAYIQRLETWLVQEETEPTKHSLEVDITDLFDVDEPTKLNSEYVCQYLVSPKTFDKLIHWFGGGPKLKYMTKVLISRNPIKLCTIKVVLSDNLLEFTRFYVSKFRSTLECKKMICEHFGLNHRECKLTMVENGRGSVDLSSKTHVWISNLETSQDELIWILERGTPDSFANSGFKFKIKAPFYELFILDKIRQRRGSEIVSMKIRRTTTKYTDVKSLNLIFKTVSVQKFVELELFSVALTATDLIVLSENLSNLSTLIVRNLEGLKGAKLDSFLFLIRQFLRQFEYMVNVEYRVYYLNSLTKLHYSIFSELEKKSAKSNLCEVDFRLHAPIYGQKVKYIKKCFDMQPRKLSKDKMYHAGTFIFTDGRN